MEMKTVILGNEYDVALIEKVKKVLIDEGGIFQEKGEGHFGSQEIKVCEVILQDIVIIVEIETYIGVSITGFPNVVNLIADKVKIGDHYSDVRI